MAACVTTPFDVAKTLLNTQETCPGTASSEGLSATLHSRCLLCLKWLALFTLGCTVSVVGAQAATNATLVGRKYVRGIFQAFSTIYRANGLKG